MNTTMPFRILTLAFIATLMLAINTACADSIDNGRFHTPFRSLNSSIFLLYFPILAGHCILIPAKKHFDHRNTSTVPCKPPIY